MKQLPLVAAIFFGAGANLSAYDWPVKDFARPHRINGTLGEYRDTGGFSHFHNGTDIGEPENTPVYPIVTGTIEAINNRGTVNEEVIVGGFVYTHIQTNANLKANSHVDAFTTLLGTINNQAHLHLIEGAEINALRNGGLNNYADIALPQVFDLRLFDADNPSWEITGTAIPNSVKKLNIRARALDAQDAPGSSNVGIYQIGYKVFHADTNEMVGNRFPTQQYDDVLGDPTIAYDEDASHGGLNKADGFIFQYFASNTKGASTPLSLSDLPGDGIYKLCVLAKDIKGNGGDIINQQGAACRSFTIGTTPPTLWVMDGSGKTLNDGDSTSNGWVTIGATLVSSHMPLKSLAVFADTNYIIPVASAQLGSLSVGFAPQANIWYWAQACDVADNCVESSFVMIPPGESPPSGPGPGPGGSRQPPHPPTTPLPCAIVNAQNCIDPPNGPGVPPGWPPGITYPGPIRMLWPDDPNSLHGPEGSVTPGQLMTYTVEFENVGDGFALGVYVKDFLDPSLDDTILTVRDMYTHVFVNDVPVSTTPANFPWSYDPRTRTVTVLTGNAGPHNGGSFVIETRLKSTSPPGTVISNQALVYFPNAMQTITPTNTVISAVPLPIQLSYVGVSSGTFLDTAGLAASLTTSSGPVARQPVSFQLSGLTAGATTDSTGMAMASLVISTAAGNYNLLTNYAGDNFFYLPSATSTPFTLNKRLARLQAPFASARPTDTVHLVLTLTDDQAKALQRQAEEPKTVVLEMLDPSGAATPLATSLLSGTTATFQFAVPQTLKLSWPLRARFDGDSRYAAAISTGTLALIDDIVPEIVITSPRGGEIFSGAASIGVNFTVHDNADLTPGATAYFVPLGGGQSVAVANGASIPASSLSEGSWQVVVRAQDWAGNYSSLTTPAFQVSLDVLSPRTSIVAGTPNFGGNPLYVSSQTTISFPAEDDQMTVGDGLGIGVAQTHYSIDGGSFTAYTMPFVLTGEGAHRISFYSVDLAGNAEAPQTRNLFLDSATPRTLLLVQNVLASTATLILDSSEVISFSTSDAGSGVAQTLYSLDGSTMAIAAVSTLSLTVGEHSLVFQSVDNVGNTEAAQIALITVTPVDTIAPVVAMQPVNGSTITTAALAVLASYSDYGRGIDLASVRLSLDGVDVTSATTVTVSSALFAPSAALSQATHTAVVQVADLAGNRTISTSTFLVDSVPPVTTLLVDGLAVSTASLVIVSTDAIAFSATDGGSGVIQTLYAVDGGTETVFLSAFGLPVGAHALAFHSRDNAGNLENLKNIFITVCSTVTTSTPPSVNLTFPSSTALGVEQALGGAVGVRGTVYDANLQSWTLSAAPGVSVSTGFATIASGATNASGQLAAWNTVSLSGYFTLKLTARNAAGDASSTATVFLGRPVIDFSIGKRDSSAVISTLKNPQGLVVRSDGLIWVAVDDDSRLLLVTSSGSLAATVGDGRSNGQGDEHANAKKDGHGRDARSVVFKHPRGLSLDAVDNLYVADRDNDRVVKLSPDGSRVLLEFNNGLKGPNDAAVDADGSVFVADTEHGRVRVFNASGEVLRDIAIGDGGSRPWGLALTVQGLWVSDQARQTISLFTRGGALLKTISGGGRVRGSSVDHIEALYVVDRGNDHVNKYDPLGSPLLSFGGRSDEDEGARRNLRFLSDPSDAAIGPDGSLWVADSGHDRIVRYALPMEQTHGGYHVAAVSDAPSAAPADLTAPAARNVDPVDGGKVERNDGTGVRVPANALAEALELTVQSADAGQDAEAKQKRRVANTIQPASEEVQYGPEGTTFSVPVTITLTYDPSHVALAGLTEDQLKVHYWNPTLGDWQALDSVVDKVAKTVSAQTTHFSVYQAMGAGGSGIRVAAANGAFGLKAAYAFPNPVRGVNAVTIRIQPGLADSVEVRVYDLSGRKVHSSSAFTLNQLDDGNGLGSQYTYDHAWDVSGVGSGVYTYVITAKKAGQADIHKTGKLGVVR